MNGARIFRDGIESVLHRWQLLIPLYALNLFSALILILMPTITLLAPAHYPAIGDAANGVDGWMILEIAMSPLVNRELGMTELSPEIQQAGIFGLLAIVIAPLIAGIVNAFLNGGILLTYHERAQPFQWKRFAWGCWHWFSSFLLFGLIQFILALVIFGTLISGTIWLIGLAGEWATWIVIPVLIVLMVVWLGVMELSGAQMIVGSRRNFVRAFLDSLRDIVRRPIHFLVFYGLVTLALIAVHLIFNLVMPYVPLSWIPLVLIVQQSFVVARLGLRLVRAAGCIILITYPKHLTQIPAAL